jgi:hypothetical protein
MQPSSFLLANVLFALSVVTAIQEYQNSLIGTCVLETATNQGLVGSLFQPLSRVLMVFTRTAGNWLQPRRALAYSLHRVLAVASVIL